MHFCILFALLLHKEAHIIIMYRQTPNCHLLAIYGKTLYFMHFKGKGNGIDFF